MSRHTAGNVDFDPSGRDLKPSCFLRKWCGWGQRGGIRDYKGQKKDVPIIILLTDQGREKY